MLGQAELALPKRAAARQKCRFQTMDEGGRWSRGCAVSWLRGLAVRVLQSGVKLRDPETTSRQHFSHAHLNRSLESLATPFVESPSPPRFLAGEKVPKADEGALYKI